MPLNNDQLLFVNTFGHDVLVSAAAGSGKTTTMIEKLKKIILQQRVPVENLLVVTFTEAAASEMKQKLYFKLQDELRNEKSEYGPFANEDLEYFYEQLFKISTADIGTLHSVCKKIVSKYFYEANIEPSFSILSNEEVNNLFNQALNKVLQDCVEAGDEEYYELYECFNDKRNNTKIKEIISKLFGYLSEKSEPHKYIEYCLGECLANSVNDNICAMYLLKQYMGVVSKFVDRLSEIQLTVDDEKLNPYFEKMIAALQGVKIASNFTEFVRFVHELDYPTLYKPKNKEYLDIHEQLSSEVKNFKETLKKFKDKIPNYSVEEFDDVTQKLNRYMSKFFELALAVEKEFTSLKMALGKLDFADLQKYAFKILQNDTIKEEVRSNYTYVFVDEYQDINQIQEDILLLISDGSNLNMIGDIKQSIYAFRQCMPEIFLAKYNANINKNGHSLIPLNTNYRCTKMVVDFVNMCFDTLITEDTIGINYQKDAQLVCGSGNSGEVNLRLLNFKTKQKNGDTEADAEDDEPLENNEAEAQQVAEIIAEVYAKEYYNDAVKQTMKINYKDIAILVRDARGYVNTLYKTLKAHNIPVSTQIKTNLFDTSEVKILHSLLKLVSNSSSDIDICTVLLSPIVGVTYDELVEMRITTNTGSFYDCFNNYILSGKNTIIIDKINKYTQMLDEFRYYINYLTLAESMNEVVVKCDLYNHYLSLPNGYEKVENIKQFIGLLDNVGFEYNISKCLEFLDSLKDKEDFLINVESGENSVKIITMHKSKGLEYPCVILSNLGKQFNNQVYREKVVLTNKFGVGINYRNIDTRKEVSTIFKTANTLFAKNQEQEEQIRLLYVAQTRARNFLYLTGCYDFSTFKANYQKNIFASKNFLELIFKCLPQSAAGALSVLNDNFDITAKVDGIDTKLANVQLRNVTDVLLESEEVKNQVLINTVQNDVASKMLLNFKAVKPKQKEMIATKNSVSGLMRDSDYVNVNELGLTVGCVDSAQNDLPLRIGTAYHTVMQNLNYTETEKEIQTVFDNLVNSGEIDSEVKGYISVEKIYKAVCAVKKLLTLDTKILKEQQFLFKTEYNNIVETSDNNQEILIQGVVDLILLNGNEAILIDFKTNKTKDIAKLINAYSLQLEVYKQAVENGLKVKVISSKLYLFENANFVEIV